MLDRHFSVVLPKYHPGDENPTTANAIAPIAALDTAGFPRIDFHFVTRPLEKKVLPSEINQGTISRRGGNNSLGNYSDDLAGIDLADRSAP